MFPGLDDEVAGEVLEGCGGDLGMAIDRWVLRAERRQDSALTVGVSQNAGDGELRSGGDEERRHGERSAWQGWQSAPRMAKNRKAGKRDLYR